MTFSPQISLLKTHRADITPDSLTKRQVTFLLANIVYIKLRSQNSMEIEQS